MISVICTKNLLLIKLDCMFKFSSEKLSRDVAEESTYKIQPTTGLDSTKVMSAC